MKTIRAVPTPVAPQDAPPWFSLYAADAASAIDSLLRRIAQLEARLKAAGIA